MKILKLVLGLLSFLCINSCKTESDIETKRVFETSFENVETFDDFYITPNNYLGTSFHKQGDSIVHTGNFAHMAWVDGANEPSSITINNNHRAYPTIQLCKTKDGSFKTPCYIRFWVWVDMTLKSRNDTENDWLSLATLSDDTSDRWQRTVLVNLSHEGYLHLMHVPEQGEQQHLFQPNDLKFPQKEWVEISIYIDFGEQGYAKVWQDGILVSQAKISGISNQLAQAHFGLYCPPKVSSGLLFNDDLFIEEVEKE